MLSIIKAKYLKDHKLLIEFSDGKRGIADLEGLVTVFRPFFVLQDIRAFSKFTVDYTVRWSDELDIAPEYLYFKAFEDDEALGETFREWGYVS